MLRKTLTALLLASSFTLTACGEQKTNEQANTKSQVSQITTAAEARALLSNPSELDKIWAELLQRPELQGAEFKVRRIEFSLHGLFIDVTGRNSKTDTPDTLTSYGYSLLDKKWGEPKPVIVMGGGKAKEMETIVLWQEAKPDLAMVFTKSDEIIKQLPQGETIKGLTSIRFYPKKKTYVADTAAQESTREIYSFTLNEKGEIIKKNW